MFNLPNALKKTIEVIEYYLQKQIKFLTIF